MDDTEDYGQYKTDKRLASFADEFKASLSSFDKAKEWADFIKYLQRLIKVLAKYESLPIVPCKVLFAKRMAQCCHPR
jgi:hypothetical protein